MKKQSRTKVPLYDLKLSIASKKLVNESLASGWLTTGPKVTTFEQKIAKYSKVKYAAAVNSATAGLQLALASLGATGRQVITTPFTFVATIEAILAAGAEPILADIDPVTLNIDPDSVARLIGKETAAVLTVDIAGYPAEYNQLRRICRENRLKLVSDTAHAFGARYRGKTIPQLTDASIYSFHSTKNLTCGEGGMVLSDGKKLIDNIRTLSLHGLTSRAFDRKKNGTSNYDVIRYGYKANMSDLHAAIGLGQLTVFEKEQAQRRILIEHYYENLSDYTDWIELPPNENNLEPSWHLFIIKLHLDRLKINRDQFIAKMAAKGIECGVHFQPVFELSYYRRLFAKDIPRLPNAAAAGKRVVSLPLFAGLKRSDIDRVCDNLIDICRRNAR
jgi:dTDP-4-amino-4,6-dideoxygalactose transaminase